MPTKTETEAGAAGAPVVVMQHLEIFYTDEFGRRGGLGVDIPKGTLAQFTAKVMKEGVFTGVNKEVWWPPSAIRVIKER